MVKIQRKFSIRPSQGLTISNNDLDPEKAYPVIAVEDNDDIGCYALIADDANEFNWVDLEDCFLASIDD